MRLRGLFWLLTALLVTILAVTAYFVFYHHSIHLFFLVEGMTLATFVYLVFFYRRIVRPLRVIGDGMELLKEQDFSSRLGRVGQPEADKLVDVFNRMMDRLKNERLHVREQNHFLDLLVNASPMGVIIMGQDGEILSANPAALRLFGVGAEGSLGGKRLSALDNPLAEELVELPMYESRTVRLSDASIYKCTHSSFVDRGYHHPFYLVESLTQEVFKAERKAYEKVIRMISHEVNNTTAGITSSLDTLEQSLVGEDMDDVRELLRVLIDRCYSMSHFITNFADVVRIPEPDLRPCSLNEVVASCKRFMEMACRNKRIELVLELSEAEPVVRLDSSLFEQVLVNIIKNAAEAIGEEGGKIYIRVEADPVRLVIADTGRGIDKETETKLFTPFFSTKPNGQGIGLIFIREVLRKHGCPFSLRTDPDGLTRFRISFPAGGA